MGKLDDAWVRYVRVCNDFRLVVGVSAEGTRPSVDRVGDLLAFAGGLVEGEPSDELVLLQWPDLGCEQLGERGPRLSTGANCISPEEIDLGLCQPGDVGRELSNPLGAEIDDVVPFGVVELVHAQYLARILVAPEDLDVGVFSPGRGQFSSQGGGQVAGGGVQVAQLRGRKAGEGVEVLRCRPGVGAEAVVVSAGQAIVVLFADEESRKSAPECGVFFKGSDVHFLVPCSGIAGSVGEPVKSPDVDASRVPTVVRHGSGNVGAVEADFGSVVVGYHGLIHDLDVGLPDTREPIGVGGDQGDAGGTGGGRCSA